ncbi:hypothetical protein [Demequina sp. NBRC 110056]|uniref:hypothetical protein n=1 Tax=Demequina sp. NBRC 110056 TaxID=1570345 RepID=UPI000A05DFE3|nr:hypothetical protein [Demequina sp. NBRC 110056]
MSRSLRIARAALAAAVATFIALGSHVLGGGQAPAGAGVLVPLGLSFAVCLQLAGQALSLWRLGTAVAVSQALFHTLFVLGSGGATMTVSGHAHHAGAITVAEGTVSHGAHGGGVMTFAHVLAAILTTAALHRAEWLLERARRGLAWLGGRLLPLAPGPVVAREATPVRHPARASAPRHLRDVVRGVRPLRGPPALSA